MKVTQIGLLPNSGNLRAKVDFAFLDSNATHPYSQYGSLHFLRQSRVKEISDPTFRLFIKGKLKRDYERNVRDFSYQLSQAFELSRFDSILSPPSRFEYALPYRHAFIQRQPNAVDLTNDFVRNGNAYSGSGSSLEAVQAGLKYTGKQNLSGFKSLLIVDDILWRGVTVAALIKTLNASGLSPQTQFAIACPLWLF